MQKITFFCIFILTVIFNFALAQQPQPNSAPPRQGNRNGNQPKRGTAKLSGTVLDAATNKGVEFANIVLFTQAGSKMIDGAVADEKGKFSIDGLGDGTYKLKVTFLGYEDKEVADVKIVNERNINVGTIKLSEGAKTLQEVTVTGQKSLIEEKVDRTVYNAEKDQLAKGGDAADVLRKVPLLTVDLEGNVSVRGNSNIKVLINNKPSTIMASSVADALKQIPADQIKTVEVITSPSARYDAEGSGGIINIITKKDRMQGYSLNVDAGVGNRSSNLGLNGSYRQGKFGVNLGGHGRAFYNKSTTDMEQKTIATGITTKQTADAKDNGIFGRYNLGMDYDIDKTQSLTGAVNFGLRNFKRNQTQLTNLFDNTSALTSSTLRDIDGKDNSNSIDASLDYLKTFKPQQEWSISSQYSRTDLTNNFTSNNLGAGGALLNSLKNVNHNLNQEITLQSDYQTPIAENQLIEFGAKGIFRSVNSDYEYLLAKDANADYTLDATRPAGVLDYKQNVAGVYSSYTLSTKNKYTIKAGARYEYTTINATQNNTDINIPNYGNLVPSLNLSKRIGERSTIKLGYGRRIQRPGLQQLNPNLNLVNQQDIRVGNPNLKPELTDNFEIGYSGGMGKTYLNLSAFSRFTNNAINQVRRPSETVQGAILTTYENIGKQQAYGTNLFANVYITDIWTVNGGFDLYYSFLEGQTTGLNGTSITVNNSGINYGGRLMTQIQWKSGWGLQAFSFMRGRQIELQGTRGGFGMYALGVKKEFSNKKGSIGISAQNFLSNGWTIKSSFDSPQFTQVSNMHLYNNGVVLNFSYKLGKMNFQETRKKTKSINNDDIKQGEDGGNSGGDTPQPSRNNRSKG